MLPPQPRVALIIAQPAPMPRHCVHEIAAFAFTTAVFRHYVGMLRRRLFAFMLPPPPLP